MRYSICLKWPKQRPNHSLVNLAFVLQGVALGLLNYFLEVGGSNLVHLCSLFSRLFYVALGQELFSQEKVFDVRDKGQKIKITSHKPFSKTPIVGIPKFLRHSLLFISKYTSLFKERVCVFQKEAISNDP